MRVYTCIHVYICIHTHTYIYTLYIHIIMHVVKLLQTMWIESKSKYKAPEARIFSIKENSEMFVKYFDLMQENLETLASMDDLLSGS